MTKKRSHNSKYSARGREKSPPKSWWQKSYIIALLGVLLIGMVAFAGYTWLKERNANPAVQEGISSGYTLSGNINYTGTQPLGRVYIELIGSDGRDTGVG